MAFFKNDLKDPNIGKGKLLVLGLQHTFTMFGATVLVPLILGLDINVALVMAGLGTWFFHLVTKGMIPVFLGSSFAFLAPVGAATAMVGLEAALGGIVVAGLCYVVMAVLVYFVGLERVVSFFPPVVTGPIIMVIGLNLAGSAVSDASGNWLLAMLALLVVVIVNVCFKGFISSLPVLIALGVSYLIAAILTLVGVTYGGAPLVDFTPLREAAWIGLPNFTLAKFDPTAIAIVAPIAICTIVEHIGDVIAVGEVCDRNFTKDPGLHRTLIGDGVATALSAMFGGPANTTYSENTGVLAMTNAKDPNIMRIAACTAIVLGFVPKLSGFILSIPKPIIGGISIVLFGMIAAAGVRNVVENQVNLLAPRNLVIVSIILVVGLGGATWTFGNVSIAGMALAAIFGIVLNKVLPGKEKRVLEKEMAAAEKTWEQGEKLDDE